MTAKNLNQEELENLEKQIQMEQPKKKVNLPTQLLNELVGQEQQNLELNISLGRRELKSTIHLDEDTDVEVGVGFKNEVKIRGAISKKF